MFADCIGVMQMVALNLTSNGFTGPLPGAWSNQMTQLAALRLYNNSLTGTLPKSWAALTQVSLSLLPFFLLFPTFLQSKLPFARP